MARGDTERKMTEEILMKHASADGNTLEDSMWAPKRWNLRKVPNKVNLPSWLKETLAQEVQQTKGTTDIGKESCPTGPSHVQDAHVKVVLSPSLPPHMRGPAQANHEISNSPSVTDGRLRGLSEVSALSGSVLEMATHSGTVTASPQPEKYPRDDEHKVFPNHVKSFRTSEHESNVRVPINAAQNVAKTVAQNVAKAVKFLNDEENLGGKHSNNNKDKGDSSLAAGSVTLAQVVPAINPVMPASKQSIQDQTINQGRLFAQLAGNKYGSPKYVTSKIKAKANKVSQPSVIAEEEEETMNQTTSIPIQTLEITASVTNDHNKGPSLPSKSSEENISIPAPSEPLAPVNPFNSAVGSCPEPSMHKVQEEDREHTTFFKSWGPQLTRDTPGMCHWYFISIYS